MGEAKKHKKKTRQNLYEVARRRGQRF